MNGVGTRRGYGYEEGRLPTLEGIAPNGRVLAEGYRNETTNGFNRGKSGYNAVSWT